MIPTVISTARILRILIIGGICVETNTIPMSAMVHEIAKNNHIGETTHIQLHCATIVISSSFNVMNNSVSAYTKNSVAVLWLPTCRVSVVNIGAAFWVCGVWIVPAAHRDVAQPALLCVGLRCVFCFDRCCVGDIFNNNIVWIGHLVEHRDGGFDKSFELQWDHHCANRGLSTFGRQWLQ